MGRDRSNTVDTRTRNQSSYQSHTSERSLIGSRAHLAKEGREIANMKALYIASEHPDFVDDPENVTLSDVLRYLNRHGQTTAEPTTDTITNLLMSGLDPKEAVVWFLYEEGGLTLREIGNALEGRQKCFDGEKFQQKERNLKAVLLGAANKLNVEIDFDPES